MTSDKDNKLAADVVQRWRDIDCRHGVELTNGAIANLEIKIAAALTTTRLEAVRDAKREAFKELLSAVDAVDAAVVRLKRRIEAAAKEGSGE